MVALAPLGVAPTLGMAPPLGLAPLALASSVVVVREPPLEAARSLRAASG